MRFVIWLVSHVAALAVAAWVFDGISFDGPSSPLTEEVQEKWLPLVLVALILGVIGAVVKPVVKLLSLPLIVLTLGLFLLVINAVMLLLTGWLAGELGIGFEVSGFWTAVGGAIVITLVSWGVDQLLGADDE